jgi:hypothetical protein
MAQAVIARPTNANQELPTPTMADITGLTITILNGSGWIRATFSANLWNTHSADQNASFRMLIDGQPQPDATRMIRLATQTGGSMGWSELFKPGAGTHTYKIQGEADLGPFVILGRGASIIIEEPGY